MDRKRNTIWLINQTQLTWSVSFIFLLSIFTLIFSGTIATCLDSSKYSMVARVDVDFQELEKKNGQGMVYEAKTEMQMDWPRRQLLLDNWPLSTPPKCTSKCDNCTPCEPAVVSVPPGPPRMMDYYPVIWKCKCGDKYYDP